MKNKTAFVTYFADIKDNIDLSSISEMKSFIRICLGLRSVMVYY